jgi:hypothetical protein
MGAKLRRRRSGVYVCSFSNACALLTNFLGAHVDISGEDHFVSATQVPGQRPCQSFIVLKLFSISPFTQRDCSGTSVLDCSNNADG